jgi:dephospho-CoA kinase
MLLVGLTGNYGMGKSTVLKMFQKLGATTYDADKIVASLFREEMVLKKIRRLLGDGVFRSNGSLNRKKVAAIIFADDNVRLSLEDILHPLVFRRINHLLKRKRSKGGIVIVEIPLLFERNFEATFQRIITVQAEQEKALNRLENKGIKREDALRRMRSQLPMEEKIRRSHFIINNDGTSEEMEQQVRHIYQQLLREDSYGDRGRA